MINMKSKLTLLFFLAASSVLLFSIFYLKFFQDVKPLDCKDVPSYAEYLRIRAEAGDAGSQFKLAFLYQNGSEDLKPDDTEALKWFRQAATGGIESAQFIMGEKESKAGNYKEAAKWFEKAAVQDNREAQKNLGILYKEGKGVLPDYSQAYFWFRLAARRKIENQSFYQDIEKDLNTKQLEKIYKKVAVWKPKRSGIKQRGDELNIAGVLCGKNKSTDAIRLVVSDECKNLRLISMTASDSGYFFADFSTKKIVKRCGGFWTGDCKPPKEWTCGRPKLFGEG